MTSTTTFAPIIKSTLENPFEIVFDTMQPTVQITFAPLQVTAKASHAPVKLVTMQPIISGVDLDAPIVSDVDLDATVSLKSASTSGVSSLKSSYRASKKSAARRWNPWKKHTYFPRYRKSVLRTTEPLGTLKPRSQYLGSRHIFINDAMSPRTLPLSKSAIRKPPKGLVIRNSLPPINLKTRTLGPRAAGRFVQQQTIAPLRESTEAPINPFPRERRSGYFSRAPFVKSMWRTDAPYYRSNIFPRDRKSGYFSIAPMAPVPKPTTTPVAAPTWAPYPRYRRSRACIALSNAPLPKNSFAPMLKGSWKSSTSTPQLDIKSNVPPLSFSTNPPLIAIKITNPPLTTATFAPFVGMNQTIDKDILLPTTSSIHMANAVKVRNGRRRRKVLV